MMKNERVYRIDDPRAIRLFFSPFIILNFRSPVWRKS